MKTFFDAVIETSHCHVDLGIAAKESCTHVNSLFTHAAGTSRSSRRQAHAHMGTIQAVDLTCCAAIEEGHLLAALALALALTLALAFASALASTLVWLSESLS